MSPLCTKRIRDMQLQRLAPRTQEASVAVGGGLAKCSHCAPAPLSPEHMRSYLHHVLVERRLAWSSCHPVACGLTFFSLTTLAWDTPSRNLPPRPGRPPLPHLLSVADLQRLFTSAPNPRACAVLMTTESSPRAGRWGTSWSSVPRSPCPWAQRRCSSPNSGWLTTWNRSGGQSGRRSCWISRCSNGASPITTSQREMPAKLIMPSTGTRVVFGA